MATPQNSGNNPARSNENTIKAETDFLQSLGDVGRDLENADPDLTAAVQTAGEYPERAAELAATLGVGASEEDKTAQPGAAKP